jgi:1-acyl-sn-glycerol-3-phosphate acyltransferase
MATYTVGPFRVEGIINRIRTILGATIFIVLGEMVLSALARWANTDTLHKALDIWTRLTSRFLGLNFEVQGLEHVDPDETYIVAPLHEGFADPLLLARLPLKLRYLVRDELFDWDHLGRFLRMSGQIEIATEADARDMRTLMRDCRDALEQGESLVVFPQGSILGIEVAFTRGAFVLADRLSRPLLPVVITGTHKVWEHPYSQTLRYGQRVSLRVLHPIEVGQALASITDLETEMKHTALEDEYAPVRHFDPERDGYWDDYTYELTEPRRRFVETALEGLTCRS